MCSQKSYNDTNVVKKKKNNQRKNNLIRWINSIINYDY